MDIKQAFKQLDIIKCMFIPMHDEDSWKTCESLLWDLRGFVPSNSTSVYRNKIYNQVMVEYSCCKINKPWSETFEWDLKFKNMGVCVLGRLVDATGYSGILNQYISFWDWCLKFLIFQFDEQAFGFWASYIFNTSFFPFCSSFSLFIFDIYIG